MPSGETVRELLDSAARRLAAAGVPDASHDAAWLMSHLLDVGPASVRLRGAKQLSADQHATWVCWLGRRMQREPAQYITGSQEFHGLAFEVRPGALVPRPETEGLVDAALRLDLPAAAHVSDLGCGCGCIAVALAVKAPALAVSALDRSSTLR